MKHTPKTIQLFFPHGNPRGIKIAHVTSRIPLAVCFPRADIQLALSRTELSGAGIYFLFGDENDIKKTVYIGESENCLERLKQHNNGDKEWNSAVVIVSKTQEMTKCHIRYLEWFCCQEVMRIKKCEIKNKSFSLGEPFITESTKADLLEMFHTISLLLSTLDYELFEETAQVQETNLMLCRNTKILAKGIKAANGFLVFKGSQASKDVVLSIGSSLKEVRKKLIENFILCQEENHLVFDRDYLFPSPSQAAGVVLGRQANGWIEWKNSAGQTLDSLFRT